MIVYAVLEKKISNFIQPNIVDSLKRYICATDAWLESGTYDQVGKVLFVVTGYRDNLLIDEIPGKWYKSKGSWEFQTYWIFLSHIYLFYWNFIPFYCFKIIIWTDYFYSWVNCTIRMKIWRLLPYAEIGASLQQ